MFKQTSTLVLAMCLFFISNQTFAQRYNYPTSPPEIKQELKYELETGRAYNANKPVVASKNDNRKNNQSAKPKTVSYVNDGDNTGRNIFTARIANALESKLKISGGNDDDDDDFDFDLDNFDFNPKIKSTAIIELGLVHFLSNDKAVNVNLSLPNQYKLVVMGIDVNVFKQTQLAVTLQHYFNPNLNEKIS